MGPSEEQGGAETEIGDAISVALGYSLDHAVQAKASQVVGHLALRNVMGILPGENCERFPQISIGETARQETEPDQQMPKRQHPGIGDAESRSPLPVHRDRSIQLPQGFFSDGAILAEAFDFENTSVGAKADLPQCGQVTQPFADGKVAGVVDGGFGTGAHFADFGNLFEILLATGVFL